MLQCRGASSEAISETGPTTIPSPSRSSSGRIRSWFRPATREVSTTCPAYASARSSRSAGTSGRRVTQAEESWSAARGTGHRARRNSVAAVVGDDQQLVGAVRMTQVLGVVLDPASATAHGPGRGRGVVSVHDPDLAGVAVLRPDHEEVPGARGVHLDLELAVGLLEHQLVRRGGRSDPVPPHLVLPPQVVVDQVEEVRRVRRPGTAGRGPRDGVVVQVPAGRQVAEPQLVDLVTVEVHGVGEHRAVRRDGPQSEVGVVRVAGQDVDVEEELRVAAVMTTT